jgi:hypothetical protein
MRETDKERKIETKIRRGTGREKHRTKKARKERERGRKMNEMGK